MNKSKLYYEQIGRLIAAPWLIRKEWNEAIGLFANVGFNGDCLTQIRSYSSMRAFVKKEYSHILTGQIRSDERIPMRGEDISLEHLPVFLEWRLRIDAMEEDVD